MIPGYHPITNEPLTRPACPGCGWEIDLTTCFCGEAIEGHDPTHTFVPIGCVCRYPKEQGACT